ncbi:MAG: ATP-binding protein [Ignavibacteriales bacterium]|nr:ATP-binding protein [Ignavibacteriales bacterium]MCF8316246.1 ATP-binding protein [Ignavibacteriales bacterium]MCF8437830.1 ATP-binding protein [Ignavibacteriales bacterium]
MLKDIDDICLIFQSEGQIHDLEDGDQIFNFVNEGIVPQNTDRYKRIEAKRYFRISYNDLFRNEMICSYKEGTHIFHVFTPYRIRGEVIGAVYMQISPDFSQLALTIYDSFDNSGAWFVVITLISLFAMFFITFYISKERDDARELLYLEKENILKEKIGKQKEASFTRRIYHAHHKSEKVVGFIKEDLRKLTPGNLEDTRYKLTKYVNFLGRIIFDMKTHKPPINVIRNPAFNVDLNNVISFLIDNMFQRVYRAGNNYSFVLEPDSEIPILHINEFVIWEILEPLIKNAIDHNPDPGLKIFVRTKNMKDSIIIEIEDNGKGIAAELLEKDSSGRKKIFLENTSTRELQQKSGYGCYIAFENCRLCGFTINAENTGTGAKITISTKQLG